MINMEQQIIDDTIKFLEVIINSDKNGYIWREASSLQMALLRGNYSSESYNEEEFKRLEKIIK